MYNYYVRLARDFSFFFFFGNVVSVDHTFSRHDTKSLLVFLWCNVCSFRCQRFLFPKNWFNIIAHMMNTQIILFYFFIIATLQISIWHYMIFLGQTMDGLFTWFQASHSYLPIHWNTINCETIQNQNNNRDFISQQQEPSLKSNPQKKIPFS